MMKPTLSVILGCCAWTNAVAAQAPLHGEDEHDLTVSAVAVSSPVLEHRLLPAEYELRDGNAATILLRLPWDRAHFVNQEVPKFSAYLEIPITETDEIRAAGPGLPAGLYSEIRRAAYRRTALWEYPIDEEAQSEVLLNDVQGAGHLVFRGLAVWIRFQIVDGQIDKGREGILVGLANARHFARTPFITCHVIAASRSNLMLDRLEELIEQPECPNFYWPLTALSTPFIPFQKAFEFEREVLARSVEGLNSLEQPRSAEQWDDLLEKLGQHLVENSQQADEKVLGVERQPVLERARKELPVLQPGLAKPIASLSEGEVLIRWFLARRNGMSDRITACSALEPPAAIENLRRVETEIASFEQDSGLPAYYVMRKPCSSYLDLTRFDRRVAALRVAEALRHYAATHKGSFPERLNQMTDTPVPLDPHTLKPFEYQREPMGATVSAPGIEDADGHGRNAIELRVMLRIK